jgi:hypothetical protein
MFKLVVCQGAVNHTDNLDCEVRAKIHKVFAASNAHNNKKLKTEIDRSSIATLLFIIDERLARADERFTSYRFFVSH